MSDSSAKKQTFKFTDSVDEDDFLYKTNSTFNKVYFEKPNESTDFLNLARTLFDLREYRKCAHFIKPFANSKNQQALFLYHYSLYLVSEQQKEEETLQNGDKISCSTIQNKELLSIENDMT